MKGELEMNKTIPFEGLTCGNCGEKIRAEIETLEGVEKADLNMFTQKMKIDVAENADIKSIYKKMQDIADKIEPGTVFIFEEEEDKFKGTDSESVSDFKKTVFRIILSAVFFGLSFAVHKESTLYTGLIFMGYTIIGGPIVVSAVNKMMDKQFFDEEFLMTVATFAALSIGEYQEALAVMLFYEVGEMLQERAVMSSRKSLTELVNLKAEYANVKRGENYEKVDPEDLQIGDIILIKPGEKVPVDGTAVAGETRMNTAALTGESVPIGIEAGEEVLSGYINETGTIEMRVEKAFNDSAVAKILDMVENAGSKKAPIEKFITKFSRIYTPTVVILAVIIALFMPLILREPLSEWVYRAAIFLVISCPCALVVSVPLGFFAGIGSCSKNGILVKGGNYLEALDSVNYVIMDKTGTLTEGVFKVQKVEPAEGFDEAEVLEYAAAAESFSNHPIAKSVVEKYGDEINTDIITNHEEIAGHGIKAEVNGREVLAGNKKLMDKFNISYEIEGDEMGTEVLIGIDGKFAGRIIISDSIKKDAKETVRRLKELGVEHVRMLTGDNETAARKVSEEIGIDEYDAGLLPDDKLRIFESIINSKKENERVAFVGDGINDAPTLARADIGIAMGGLGSDAAVEVSDIVIVNDEPSKIPQAIYISKRVKKIVLQNIVFALGVKIIVLIMGALGLATMWEAVFADVGVSVLAVLNSMRALRLK